MLERAETTRVQTDHRALPAIAALLSLVLFAVSANIVFAALLTVSREFGVPAEAFANVAAVQFAGFFLSSIVGGLAADRHGKRVALQTGCLCVFVGAGLWAGARGVPAAYLGGFVMGAGGGVLESMSSALLTDLFPARRKFYLNLSQIAYCCGAVGGPFLMGWLLPRGVSWRWFFAGTSAGALALLVLYACTRLPATTTRHPDDTSVPRSFPPVRAYAVPCVVIFFYVFAEMGAVTFMRSYLQGSLGAPENWAIYALAIFWAAMTLGRLLCAFLPEGHAYELSIAALLAGSASCMCLQAFVESWVGSLGLFALTGLFFAGTWPLIVGMAASRQPEATGAVVGLTVACGSLGCVVAPVVLGMLFGRGHSGAAFMLKGACLFAACFCLVLSRRRWKAAE